MKSRFLLQNPCNRNFSKPSVPRVFYHTKGRDGASPGRLQHLQALRTGRKRSREVALNKSRAGCKHQTEDRMPYKGEKRRGTPKNE